MNENTTKTKTEHRSIIGNLTIASKFPIIVYGSVRGLVSEHHKAHAAAKSLHADQGGCKSQGGYSDARIYIWEESEGWVEIGADGLQDSSLS